MTTEEITDLETLFNLPPADFKPPHIAAVIVAMRRARELNLIGDLKAGAKPKPAGKVALDELDL